MHIIPDNWALFLSAPPLFDSQRWVEPSPGLCSAQPPCHTVMYGVGECVCECACGGGVLQAAGLLFPLPGGVSTSGVAPGEPQHACNPPTSPCHETQRPAGSRGVGALCLGGWVCVGG